MASTVSQVMTEEPTVCNARAPVSDAAKQMRDSDIGEVIVVADDAVKGIVTDRDIVVRVVADARDPQTCELGDICSAELTTIAPSESIDDAVELMRKASIERIPVVDGDRPVGIVSLGDLASEADRASAVRDIQATELKD